MEDEANFTVGRWDVGRWRSCAHKSEDSARRRLKGGTQKADRDRISEAMPTRETGEGQRVSGNQEENGFGNNGNAMLN
jgi:hypothetical protein